MARCGQCESRLTAGALYCAACGARRTADGSAPPVDESSVKSRASAGPLDPEGIGGSGSGGIAGPHRAGPSEPLLLDRPLIGIGAAPEHDTPGHYGGLGLGGLDGLGVVEVGSLPGSGRRRALALGAGAVVVVGTLAVLSRGGDHATGDNVNDSTAAATTTTRSRSTTTIRPAVTTAPPVTGTPTTAVQFLGPLLPEPSGAALVFVATGGRVQRANLDTDRIESLPIELRDNGGPIMSLGADAIVAMDFESRGPSVAIYPGGGAEAVYVSGQQFWPSRTPGRVWVLENSFDGASEVRLREFDASGTERRGFELSDVTNWAIPVGDAIFLSLPGAVYRLDPGTGRSRLVAYGEIRSSYGRATVALPSIDVLTCDEAMKCVVKTYDPDGSEIASRAPDVPGSRQGVVAESASPDGKYSATFDYETSRLKVLDTNGAVIWDNPNRFRGLPVEASSLRWSNDSKWLFIQTLLDLKAWSPTRTGLVDIALGRVSAFDVVPEPSPGG
jgi:hypothetical protein